MPSCFLQQWFPYPPSPPPPLPLPLGAVHPGCATLRAVCASSTCHLAMNRSAASRTPGTTFPPSLLHGPTVQFQLQTALGSLPWSLRWIEKRCIVFQGSEPVVRWSTLSRVFPTAMCANMILLGSRPSPCRTILPAKSTRFRMVVPMLSHFVFLRALGCERLVWSARR